MSDPELHLLCYAWPEGATEPSVLMVRRGIVQTRSDRRPVPPFVPRWAGQWGWVGGAQGAGRATLQAAYAMFLDQAGLDLADPGVSLRYGVGAIDPRTWDDDGTGRIQAVYLQCSAAGLGALGRDIAGALHGGTPAEDVLQNVEVLPRPEAATRIGPLAPPDGGWLQRLEEVAWPGTPPTAAELSALADELAACGGAWPVGSRLALDRVPGPAAASSASAPWIETAAAIANNTPQALRLGATAVDEDDWASADGRPERVFADLDIPPFGQVSAGLRVLAACSSARVRVGFAFEGDAARFDFVYDQADALTATSGDYRVLEINGGGGACSVLQSVAVAEDGRPKLVLMINRNREV
ncbi:hypothetical protein LDO32_05585 [Luteimonas sp. Y-2-2-4F]|nr:hypothetical protein [Luteimonas sp. Y-2-2-4F]MCD9031200.1 hypothetical protein [Luteimonas sp. Y-2-2-4F]